MNKVLQSIVLFLGMLMVPVAAFAQNIYGDVNGDLEVNIADVNAVIKVILGGPSIQTADVNNDDEINIADVNAIISVILNGTTDPLLEICKRVSEIDHEIRNYYMECKDLDELKQHAAEIEAMDGVEYIYYGGNTTMFVEMKDFGTMLYSYFPTPDSNEVAIMEQKLLRQTNDEYLPKNDHAIDYQDFDNPRVLIVNQTHNDQGKSFAKYSANLLRTFFTQAGFEVSPIETSPNVEFFRNGIFGHDYVFLITHGSYGYNRVKKKGTHWLYTSEEIPFKHNIWDQYYVDSEALAEVRNMYDSQDVGYGFLREIRGGESVVKCYLVVSEHFIGTSTNSFQHPGKGVFFNVACQSMMGPNLDGTDAVDTGLADVFLSKGAGAYLGYDQTDMGGAVSGLVFWSRLLSGKSIENAYISLSDEMLHENHSTFWTNLKLYPEQADFLKTVINRPKITYEDKSSESMLHVDLHAGNVFSSLIQNDGYYEWDIMTDLVYLSNHLPFRYGFELSESEQFNDAVSLGEKTIGDEGCGFVDNQYYLNMTQSITYDGSQADSKIKPNTTYWARAYVHDYVTDCYNYSEPVSFTTANIDIPVIPTEAIDLGLPSGTKWAPFNVDATKPEEYGGYYAWGETETKEWYSWGTYEHCDGTKETCHDIGENISGTMYDVAHVKWGHGWHMPTLDQIDELVDYCTMEWTSVNGVNGAMVTGPNGNKIFLPAAGYATGGQIYKPGVYGLYKSGSLYPGDLQESIVLNADQDGFVWIGIWNSLGHTVRPVK